MQTALHDWTEVNLFSVVDGHGPLGHKVARVVSKGLVDRIKKNLKRSEQPRELLVRTFEEVETYLETNNQEVIENSGTTCVAALQVDLKLLVANVGDSRCFLGFHSEELGKDGRPSYDMAAMTYDHVPSVAEERDRILREGGVVDSIST